MCGIIGYTGQSPARDILLDGLLQLEYRGYDSAGIALSNDRGDITLIKRAGKVETLKEACASLPLVSHCGIGHTRWATHGGVTDANAHPHRVGKIALIHNGIIENYKELAERFCLSDSLQSETDTEVAAALINRMYEHSGDPITAIRAAVKEIVGSFAFCILFEDHPGTIYAVRNVSPMVATVCPEGAFIASDLTALLKFSKKYFIVPEYHILTMTDHAIAIQDLAGNPFSPEWLTVSWNVEAAQKGGYPHFMLKEIFEQPEAIRNTIVPRITDQLPDFSCDEIPDSLFTAVSAIRIIACGTAMHAGMVSKTLIESGIRIPVTVSIASEFRYEKPLIDANTLVIAISQSGETIDTLEALRLSRRCGARTLAVVNVKGSTIARESDYVLYTHAGPEIAVASTKAYTVQLAALYLIACKLGLLNGRMTKQEARTFISGLQNVIPTVEEVLRQTDRVKMAVKPLRTAQDAFFIGRGIDYTLSLEGALKLKEISYIHAEAYAAGELKHGTIALITDGVPVIALATQQAVYSKTISNIREVKARGAYVIFLSCDESFCDERVCDLHFSLPQTEDAFAVFPATVILQLIAYYTSAEKGLDVDKPRNLAKSVTVE